MTATAVLTAVCPPFDRWPVGVQWCACRLAKRYPSDPAACVARATTYGAAAIKRAEMSGSEKQTTGAALVRIVRAIIGSIHGLG